MKVRPFRFCRHQWLVLPDGSGGDAEIRSPGRRKERTRAMVPLLGDILQFIETKVPSFAAEEWDNCGLQVGDMSTRIEKLLVALDPSLDAVREASKINAQLLITHHPLIFRPLSQIDLETYPGRIISESLNKGICIVALHTNLDTVRGGINDILADLLDLENARILKKKEQANIDDMGLGRIGDLPAETTLNEIAREIKNLLKAQSVKVVGDANRHIKRVAVVGGSGGDMVSFASSMGADLLVTGDISHHQALEAEQVGIALVDGGHYNTEKVALGVFSRRLRNWLKENGWQVGVEEFEGESEPAWYV
ncbi:MAG: Nif3-like dinuclear metal center hexameric protein [Deltaproteobacteria bacterium]|nr:Nif3-like dinuclear metal center hexameric protein [Deltaproteobacteria bacterium]MBW1920132.1 Nif3-like dinuclear metal center hexameric protein [Deltaproteobacteria bacterium]MBW1934699.1 Nif3-like dinuclear metal center hexameric protein [Deltaproteobacteria bacterium]MBW1977330.1 Nif3-like dinuclear metal center hexameric protein [Deltaproteobacteria bacterium]MBW2043980.1 Nif3-like dinuclear metal center hexameric protein [Deltaproteobacteria bacterium]